MAGELRPAPLFRIRLAPTEAHGLQKPSDVRVDKVQSVAREKGGAVFGRVSEADLLAVFLGVI